MKYPKYKREVVRPASVETYFMPRDNCTKMLTYKFQKAISEIFVAQYSFTHPILSLRLAECLKRGVSVRVLLDYAASDSMSEYEELIEYGVDVRAMASYGKMHHKFTLIDRRIVITGSANYSQAADKRNIENLLVISSRSLAEIYRKEFLGLWKKALKK